MPRGVSRPTQGLEVALLTGGAATAAGLYVSNAVLQRTYVASRRLFSWLLPEEGEANEEARGLTQIDCAFMRFPNPAVLFARERDGSFLLLGPTGVFYVQAPSMSIYVVDITSDGKASLEPHAYYLYQAALSWMPDTKANQDQQNRALVAWHRVKDLASECMLHMLLNDLFQVATRLPPDDRPLVLDLLQKLSPVRGRLSLGTPSPPTAQALLQTLTSKQWHQLKKMLPITSEAFRRPSTKKDFDNFLGAAFNPSNDFWKVDHFPVASKTVVIEGVGRCKLEGYLRYVLFPPSKR
jgi:hypothetical protein